MPRFFAEIQGETAIISGRDVNHIKGPLRKRPGDELLIRDFSQGYRARITSFSRGEVLLDIIEKQELLDRGSRLVCLAVSIIDLREMDELVRITTELGVARICPLIAEKSNIRSVSPARQNRWLDIAGEAVKQSQRKTIPVIETPKPLSEFVINAADLWEARYFASISGKIKITDVHQDALCIAMGPEGGFTQNEEILFIGNGFTSLNMGKTVLRTLAAAVAAASILCM